MARRLVSTPVRMRGGATLGFGARVRIYDDEALTTLSTIYRRSTGVGTQPNPLLPNAGMTTALTVNGAAVDTTITVASTAGFQVGDLIPIRNTTTFRYRVITAINPGTGVITLDSALGAVFSTTDTIVGAPEMRGHIWGWLEIVVDPFAEIEDIASGRRSPPLQIQVSLPASVVSIKDQGSALGQFSVVNFLGTAITAVDGGAGQLNVTVGGDFTDQTFITVGAIPATSGTIRLPNNSPIAWRNAANSANVWAVSVDTNNNLALLSAGTVVSTVIVATEVARQGTTYLALLPTSNPATAGILRFPNGSASAIDWRNAANTQNIAGIYVASDDVLHLALGAAGVVIDSGIPLSVGTTPAVSGLIRIPNASLVSSRNGANSADIGMAYVDASNVLNLGHNFGTAIASGIIAPVAYLAVGTTPAVTGTIRVPRNAGQIVSRNSANSADLNLVGVSASDQLLLMGSFVTDGSFTSIGTTPATAGTIRLPSAGTIKSRNAGNTADEQIWPLLTAEASLGAPVAMTTANTYYDGPSVSLAPGTWLVIGTISFNTDNNGAMITAKLWDGTTVESSAIHEQGATAYDGSISLSGIVVLAATTTLKISLASTSTAGSILAAAPNNGAGNNASHIKAVRIG